LEFRRVLFRSAGSPAGAGRNCSALPTYEPTPGSDRLSPSPDRPKRLKESCQMRNVLTLLAAGLLFTAGAAHAVPANFTNTLTLEVSGFDAVSFSGSGTADTEPNGPV